MQRKRRYQLCSVFTFFRFLCILFPEHKHFFIAAAVCCSRVHAFSGQPAVRPLAHAAASMRQNSKKVNYRWIRNEMNSLGERTNVNRSLGHGRRQPLGVRVNKQNSLFSSKHNISSFIALITRHDCFLVLHFFNASASDFFVSSRSVVGIPASKQKQRSSD